ncbi:MAG: TIGR01212 family radical SAM protein [Prolixibacteraceae bacterium]|nr:TIGR01212 family radical SAM protein [Prolixibacteraceae bacterium]
MAENQPTYPWGHHKRYNDFPTYFRKKFSGRVQKVSVDAGFTCPNRDGEKGRGGCTYCNNQTFKPGYCELEKSISWQVQKGIDFFARKYDSMRFLAYFQSYTNTYAPLPDLKRLYEEALENPKIIGLVIATRPDCLGDEVLDYLQQLSKKWYVMVEIGVESCDDDTLKRINRCHTFDDSVNAIENLAARGIHNCVHMILGLPGETREAILKQPVFLSGLPVENLKMHQLQIHKGTVMAKQYAGYSEWFELYEKADDYIELVVDYLELLRPSIVIERFISQSPPGMLVAPRWGLKNFEFVAKVEKRLAERDTFQGRLYNA